MGKQRRSGGCASARDPEALDESYEYADTRQKQRYYHPNADYRHPARTTAVHACERRDRIEESGGTDEDLCQWRKCRACRGQVRVRLDQRGLEER